MRAHTYHGLAAAAAPQPLLYHGALVCVLGQALLAACVLPIVHNQLSHCQSPHSRRNTKVLFKQVRHMPRDQQPKPVMVHAK